MSKIKSEKYKCVAIKFYKDGDKVIAQPYGFASPIGVGKTKTSAFENIKPKIRLAQKRGNIIGCK